MSVAHVTHSGWLHLLAEMPDATDLKGAGGLRVLHLQVDGGAHMFGHADALQQRSVHVEMRRHDGSGPSRMTRRGSG